MKITEFGISEKILGKIIEVIKKFPEVSKAVVYGSRARGDYKNYSDIDIALFGTELTSNDFLDVSHEINSLPIVFKMNIVKFDEMGKEMQDQILRDGKEIYKVNQDA